MHMQRVGGDERCADDGYWTLTLFATSFSYKSRNLRLQYITCVENEMNPFGSGYPHTH